LETKTAGYRAPIQEPEAVYTILSTPEKTQEKEDEHFIVEYEKDPTPPRTQYVNGYPMEVKTVPFQGAR
jgi:hypothetical protein